MAKFKKPRKPTREELESEIQALRPFQEAFWLLRQGHAVERITSEEYSVGLIGSHRASGGVVLLGEDGSSAVNACNWCAEIEAQGQAANPYLRSIVHTVRKRMSDAVKTMGDEERAP